MPLKQQLSLTFVITVSLPGDHSTRCRLIRASHGRHVAPSAPTTAVRSPGYDRKLTTQRQIESPMEDSKMNYS